MSEAYDPDNLLDRLSARNTLELDYAHLAQREQELLARHLPLAGGRAVSVGCGWHPGRHLLPSPQWHLTAVDVDGDRARCAVEDGGADAGLAAAAGELDELSSEAFDVVLYRLVLHHIAYTQDLTPIFAEAARLLRPGGFMVAIEPGLWHPVGAALALANRLGVGTPVHGTPDDIPLSPRLLMGHARRAGLQPRLFALSYSWRRLPPAAQRLLWRLDPLGERAGLSSAGHTLLLLAQR